VNPGFRTGYLAIIGRPNVGKSTLTNRLVGAKVSITSKKAQTTRHRIHGVLTTDDAQFVFVDTPGFQMAHKNALNRLMNRSVTSTFADVDVILLVVEAGNWGSGESEILRMLPADTPVVLVINKIDRLVDKSELLPFMAKVSALHEFADLVPLSAEKGLGTDELLRTVAAYLPKAIRSSPPTTSPIVRSAFLAAELLREKLFRNLGAGIALRNRRRDRKVRAGRRRCAASTRRWWSNKCGRTSAYRHRQGWGTPEAGLDRCAQGYGNDCLAARSGSKPGSRSRAAGPTTSGH
jgi:GTP-binding protein Era